MSDSDNRPLRAALIPWVIALVALFALNVLAAGYSIIRKSESPEGIGLAQAADEVQLAGRVANPLVYVDPAPAAGTGVPGGWWVLLRIEAHRDQPERQVPGGAIRGRAPPAMSLA
jgi:hypothetical protein